MNDLLQTYCQHAEVLMTDFEFRKFTRDYWPDMLMIAGGLGGAWALVRILFNTSAEKREARRLAQEDRKLAAAFYARLRAAGHRTEQFA